MIEQLKKLNELLGNEKDLILLKGQVKEPQKFIKNETGEPYYSFTLKTLRNSNTKDEYSHGYNTFYIVMGTEVAKQYSDQDISNLKNNEILLLASPRSIVKQIKEGYKVNQTSYYVTALMQTKEINNNSNIPTKVVNL